MNSYLSREKQCSKYSVEPQIIIMLMVEGSTCLNDIYRFMHNRKELKLYGPYCMGRPTFASTIICFLCFRCPYSSFIFDENYRTL